MPSFAALNDQKKLKKLARNRAENKRRLEEHRRIQQEKFEQEVTGKSKHRYPQYTDTAGNCALFLQQRK
jgi:hypothetical protein